MSGLTRQQCTVEFDHHGPEYAADPMAVTNAARTVCPVAWSAAHGGFWLVSGYAEAFAVLRDDDNFSSELCGVSIPDQGYRSPPIDVDPPLYGHYRRALVSDFSPKSMDDLAPAVRDWTNDALDKITARGSGDFILDLGTPIPARAIMRLLGLDPARTTEYAEIEHEQFAHPFDQAVRERVMQRRAELLATVRARESERGDDVISHIWTSGLLDAAGAAYESARPERWSLASSGPWCPAAEWRADEEVTEVINVLLGAGVDTTTNMFAATAMWLAEHPAKRHRLIDDDLVWPTAIEEFLRYFSMVGLLARTAARDTDFFGHTLKKGDRVLVSFLGANHDPREFERPDEIILDRTPNRHLAFGVGIHRCIGSNLARMVFPILLKGLLTRIPDYAVLPEETEIYPHRGVVAGWVRMPFVSLPTADPAN